METIQSLWFSITALVHDLINIEFLTGILVIVTAFYAWTTFKMLKANREVIKLMADELEQSTRPQIVVQIKIKPDYPLLFLHIKNTGKTSALGLELTLNKPFYQLNNDKKNIQDFTAFRQSIASFPPDSVLEFLLIEGPQIYGTPDLSRTPLEFEVTAKYQFSNTNKTVEETHHIDLKPFDALTLFQEQSTIHLREISSSLSNIAKKISNPH